MFSPPDSTSPSSFHGGMSFRDMSSDDEETRLGAIPARRTVAERDADATARGHSQGYSASDVEQLQLEVELREAEAGERVDAANRYSQKLEAEVGFLQSKVQALLAERQQGPFQRSAGLPVHGTVDGGSRRGQSPRATARATATTGVPEGFRSSSPHRRKPAAVPPRAFNMQGNAKLEAEHSAAVATAQRLDEKLGAADAELARLRDELKEVKAENHKLKRDVATNASRWKAHERQFQAEFARKFREVKAQFAAEKAAELAKHEADLHQIEYMYRGRASGVGASKAELGQMQSHYHLQINQMKDRIRILRAALTEEERKNALLEARVGSE